MATALIISSTLGFSRVDPMKIELIVDDSRRQIVMKPFSRLTVKTPDGEVIGEVKRGLGRPSVTSTEKGRSLRFTGR